MSLVPKFIRKWNKWYRVLRHRNGWTPCAMAFGWRIADRNVLP